MLIRFLKTTIVFAGFLSLTVYSTASYAESPSFGAFSEPSTFNFNSKLKNAETWTVDQELKFVKGKWLNGEFSFETLGPRSKIQIVQDNVDGEQLNRIRFNPLQGAKRYIRFINVKPGSTLSLSYGIDSKVETEQISYLDFRVLIGKHVLSYFRVPVKDGWTTEDIPMGVAGFWDRDLTVTFEMFTNSSERVLFSFSAEIRP